MMRLPLPATSLAAVLLACGAAAAQFPVQDMKRSSLGLAYTLGLRGADITEAAVPAHEVIHLISIAYAPLPYAALTAGVGLDRLTVDSYRQTAFKGDYGISPAFGFSLYSPYLVYDLLRVTAGSQFLYLDSDDGRGYRYSGFIGSPFAGIILSPSVFVDVAAGARGHFIDGTMQAPRNAPDQPFSNVETVRGYLSLTLKTPFERAFMNLDADFSPAFDTDWSRGPRESSIGFSFGAVLGWKGRTKPPEQKPKYFPSYSEMKEKQDQMAEEIR